MRNLGKTVYNASGTCRLFWIFRQYENDAAGGGYVLWIELDKNIDAFKLYQDALKKISA
jgi:DNA-binding transcriptional MocR family regulator